MPAERRRHEVAESREARERERIRAGGDAEPRDLRQPAGDEAGLRVVPEAHAVARAGPERHDVLQRAGELDADQVVVRVHAEGSRADEGLELARHRRILRGDDRRRRQPARDLARDVRAGEDRERHARHRGAEDLAHAAARLGLDPLRRRRDRVAVADERCQEQRQRADAVARDRDNDALRCRGLFERPGDPHGVGDAHAGEVTGVFPPRRQLRDVRGVASPQRHAPPGSREEHGECRAPRTRPEDGERRTLAQERIGSPRRGSRPAMRRRMLSMWRTTTIAPPTTMNERSAQWNGTNPSHDARRYPTRAPATDDSEPTDTVRVRASATPKKTTATSAVGLAMKSSAPNPVAIPRPPRPCSVTGQQCPTTANVPATASATGRQSPLGTSACARNTASAPFATSRMATSAAAPGPSVRSVFVAPVLPLPSRRRSTLRYSLPTTNPLEKDPMRYATAAVTARSPSGARSPMREQSIPGRSGARWARDLLLWHPCAFGGYAWTATASAS